MARRIDIPYTPHVKPVTVDLEVSVKQPGGKVTELFNELVAYHKLHGLDDTNAKDAAYLELAMIYQTGHGKFRDHYVRVKGSKLDMALEVQHQALHFYDQAMRGPGPPDVPKLRAILKRANELLDDLGTPARKMIDDVEVARAARALETLEAMAPTPLKQTPAQQRPVMTPHEKFDILTEKGWTLATDGLTATKVEDGVTFVATIDMTHPDKLVTVQITKPRESPKIIREGSVQPRHGDAPKPAGNVIQSHHGVQDDLCAALGGPDPARSKYGDLGYRRDDAPGIWLRDHKGGSPHNKITGLQQGRKSRDFDNFGAIREQGIKDLKAAERPRAEIQAFVKAWDDWFNSTILPKIRAKYPDPAKQREIIGVFTEVY